MTDGQRYWATWLAEKASGLCNINIKDYSVGGIDSFFPKSFVISNHEEQTLFFEEMVFLQIESHLKQFIADYEKDSNFFSSK